ncbi:MAG: serine/threonine-protein kinase [Planctomycetota bacterium]
MSPQEKLVSQVALKLGLLDKEQLKACLRVCRERNEADASGLIAEATAQGFLDEAGAGRLRIVLAKLAERTAPVDSPDPEPDASASDVTTAGGSAADTPEEPPPEGAPTIEGYRVLSVIGQGAMATVYRARQTALDKLVALKVLAPRLRQSETDRARFLREARAAAKVVHPGVIAIYDTDESNGVPYIAMELVEGKNLSDVVSESGPLTEEEVLGVGRAIADALNAAHARSLVHRDIKPENIIRATDGRMKLCDLGLARPFTASDPTLGEGAITDHGVTLGTPYFVSPEQARGLALDIRSDLYSLGVTLFYLATGEPPFKGDTPPVVMKRHVTDKPPAPSSLRMTLSPPFDELVLKLLEKSPARRYQTPKAVGRALARLLGEVVPVAEAQPVRPRRRSDRQPRPRPGEARRRARRNRRQRLPRLAKAVAVLALVFTVLYLIKGAMGPIAPLR